MRAIQITFSPTPGRTQMWAARRRWCPTSSIPTSRTVVDIRSGDLTLIDTNRLISTHKLAQLHAAGQSLDVERRRIHALLLRRLMYLESRYLSRTRDVLVRDPVYARYLDSAGFEKLFAASAAAGEHIR